MCKYEKELKDLDKLLGGIGGPDLEAAEAARVRQAMLAKPPGSLGRLEDLSVQLAAITGRVQSRFDKKALLVFCADNGVVCEGVAATPQSVTAAQTVNLVRGKTGAAVLARQYGCETRVIDVGVNAVLREPGIISRKIAYGTNNIAAGPAMTREQALKAILTGAEAAADAVRDGAGIIGIGEMGIGNTTTSSAVISVLTGCCVRDVTGRGAGLTDEAYANKIDVIERAIRINRPDPADAIDVLAKVGGFDIAAMCGAFLGAAFARVPAVIDGLISAAAALCAVTICDNVRTFLIASHASFEKASGIVLSALGVKPLFDFEMRLGEGSGCPVAMAVLDGVNAVMNDMATFEEAEINDSYLEPLRGIDAFSAGGGEV